MKLVVNKNHLGGKILYKSLVKIYQKIRSAQIIYLCFAALVGCLFIGPRIGRFEVTFYDKCPNCQKIGQKC